MAESKSDCFPLSVNERSEKSAQSALSNANSLALVSEWRASYALAAHVPVCPAMTHKWPVVRFPTSRRLTARNIRNTTGEQMPSQAAEIR